MPCKMMLIMIIYTPVWPTWAVGALFRGATRCVHHINHVKVHISRQAMLGYAVGVRKGE